MGSASAEWSPRMEHGARHSELDEATRNGFAEMRRDLQKLLKNQGGDVFTATSEVGDKLAALQLVIDAKPAESDDFLIACGVVFGDAVAQALETEWVMPELGDGSREPALWFADALSYVSPISILVSRLRNGEHVNLIQLALQITDQLEEMSTRVADSGSSKATT